MKKSITLLAALCIAIGGMQSAAFADNDKWFHHYDNDRDGHWNYDEFRNAHSNWYKHHRGERRYSDEELRGEFDRRDAEHHGWVAPDQVRDWHHW